MRDFRKLDIWSQGLQLVEKTYLLTSTFPDEEKYGLSRQIRRSAVSIPSNIAEGCRGSNQELKHFLSIALGSSFELETQVTIAGNLGYLEGADLIIFVEELHILQKRINAFRSRLN